MVNTEAVREKFEKLARREYPQALSKGRHPVHGTYIHSGLEKRWKGFLSCTHLMNSEIQAYREELSRLALDSTQGTMPDVQARILLLLERFA